MLALIGFYVLLIVYFFACLLLIMVILAQEGKGGGLSGLAGASALGETFGFGAASAALRKWTRNAAITFIVLTIVLTFYGEHVARSRAEKFLMGGGEVMSAPPTAEKMQQTPAPGGTPLSPAGETEVPPSTPASTPAVPPATSK